jgi:hypothetical protein
MSTITIIVIINTILGITAILAWLYFRKKFKEPAAITALAWLINVTIFGLYYLYLLFAHSVIQGNNLELIRTWGSLINTHGIFLLMCGAIIACNRLKNNKTYMDRLMIKIEKEKEDGHSFDNTHN